MEDNVKSIEDRYKNLQKNAQDNIKLLEETLDIYQQFYDLHKAQQDNQKQLWDRLNSYLDYGGNKQAIQHRLDNVIDLQDHLPEININLKDLENYVQNKILKLPARAQETMHRDVNNLRFDNEKFVGALMDLKSSLENRLKQWTDYENSLDKLLSWLTDAELALKNYNLKSTIEEKQEQLDKYQVRNSL